MHTSDLVGVLALCAGLACSAEPTRPPTPVAAGDPPAATPADPPAATPPAATPPAATPDPPPAATPAPAVAAADPSPADPPAAKPGPAESAKSSAPVTVTADLTATSAALKLRFAAEGTGVLVKVWGVDGLEVKKPAAPTALASVRRGQDLALAVEFTAPPGKASNLAVSVRGRFGGAERTHVQSFTVGAAADPPPPTRTDKDGRGVKVMKAH
jgi:hypothetical protein